VSTVSGVESSSVMISWMGPGGAITSGGRVTINPTTPSGNDFMSTLNFMYLMEGDGGTYTCNVVILDTSESESVELETLTSKLYAYTYMYLLTPVAIVPRPIVTVTAPEDQMVGQPLTLTCNAVTVRGITSNVYITWRRDGANIATRSDISLTTTNSTSQIYTNTLDIGSLGTDDNDITYQCLIEVSSIMESGQFTLDVTGKLCITNCILIV